MPVLSQGTVWVVLSREEEGEAEGQESTFRKGFLLSLPHSWFGF